MRRDVNESGVIEWGIGQMPGGALVLAMKLPGESSWVQGDLGFLSTERIERLINVMVVGA